MKHQPFKHETIHYMGNRNTTSDTTSSIPLAYQRQSTTKATKIALILLIICMIAFISTCVIMCNNVNQCQ